MCVVSMIGDHYRDKWRKTWPSIYPSPGNGLPGYYWDGVWTDNFDNNKTVVAEPISRKEFDALRKDVEEMKELLKRAKEYDERNGEPDCEVDEKMDLLRRVAKFVGVGLDDVIGKAK